MTAQALGTGAGRNSRTIEEARAFVAYVESLFMPWNIDALVEGFTQDCEVRFGNVQLRGRDALRAFSGDMLTNIWESEWDDAQTGAGMKGFGVELWVMREGKIALWEAAFNVSRADETGVVEAMLR